MSKSGIPEDFGSKLLRVDKSLRSERYKEHRMQLENQLLRAESHEQLVKRVVIGAILLAAMLLPVVASRVFGSPDPYDKNATVLSVTAGTVYAVACMVVFIGIASYYSRFTPRVRQAREKLRDELICELQREVANLRLCVEGKSQVQESRQSDSE